MIWWQIDVVLLVTLLSGVKPASTNTRGIKWIGRFSLVHVQIAFVVHFDVHDHTRFWSQTTTKSISTNISNLSR